MSVDPYLHIYAEIITKLTEKWTPHQGQINVGQFFFRDEIKSIFVQCGRKWGKTELALYLLWRVAWQYPGSPCYFIAPFQKQAKEIVWADPRIKNFGPREWLLDGSSGINNTEMRLNFKNGSFIKVDGSDNYEAYRGPRFKICVYEEYKDHRPEFRRAMRPNAAVLDGLEIFIGSPPDRECDYTIVAEDHRTDPDKAFYHAPTTENPHISKDWLEKEKRDLYARGEGDVWEREYEARFVKGGASKIFPMIGKEIIRPHAEIMQSLFRDRKKLQWAWFADPAAASCFAVLFIAVNPYTKQIYALDEIYETDQGKMSVKQIGKEIIAKRNELYDDREWDIEGYDEAETWFRNEWIDNFPDEGGLQPSHKALNDKDSGLSLIKDILLAGKLTMSDRCKKTFWEMDNYFKDKNGKIPKSNDHIIDNARYLLASLGYELNTKQEYIESKDEDFRGESLESSLKSKINDTDWESWN